MRIYKKAFLPARFAANGLNCGIKKTGEFDLALIYSETMARVCCCITANKIKAAPLQVNMLHMKRARGFRAIVANSGNANCFTGRQGITDAGSTALSLAEILKVKKEEVLVASTGIIGRRLPLGKIQKAVPKLVKGLSVKGIDNASRAIMTTDTVPKKVTVRFNIGDRPVTICGIAKGAGMIAPNMATMLTFITTDAFISQGALDKALGISVEESFNCITVDGCMSTNDTVIIMANGASGNTLIDKGKNFDIFLKALKLVCLELAKMIVRDAEGSTKFIEIKVIGARSRDDAKKAALAIANSSLFKTAVFGENPNFGRVVAAVGASDAEFEERRLKVKMSSLNRKDVKIQVSLGSGVSSVTIYTSDLTPEYIKINAEYN